MHTGDVLRSLNSVVDIDCRNGKGGGMKMSGSTKIWLKDENEG